MFTLFFFIFASVFLLIAIVLWFATDISIEEKIREELHKYGYNLLSIKSTKRKIPTREKPAQSRKMHLVMDYSPGKAIRYKEITFCDKVNRSFQCVVAIETSPFLSSKLYFESDLGDSSKHVK